MTQDRAYLTAGAHNMSAWEQIPDQLQDAVYEFGAYGDENYVLDMLVNYIQEYLMCSIHGCDSVSTPGTEFCREHVDIHMI